MGVPKEALSETWNLYIWNTARAHFIHDYFYLSLRQLSHFPFPQTLCLCSSLYVCVDMCDGAQQHAGDELRQTLTSVRGSNQMSRMCSRTAAPGSPVSSILVVHFLRLCHCEGCYPLWQIQSTQTRSYGGRIAELLWRSVWEVGTAWWVNAHLEHSPLHPPYSIWLHRKGKHLQPVNWGDHIDYRTYRRVLTSFLHP